MRHLDLISELKNGAGTVNLSATAREYGISRGTLLAYIAEEAGLMEQLQARRRVAGQGYVQAKRGTRVSRKKSKVTRLEQRALRQEPQPDAPMNDVVAARLAQYQEPEESWERFLVEMGRDVEAPELTAEEHREQVAELIRRGPFSEVQLRARAANAALASTVVFNPAARKARKSRKANSR